MKQILKSISDIIKNSKVLSHRITLDHDTRPVLSGGGRLRKMHNGKMVLTIEIVLLDSEELQNFSRESFSVSN